MATLGSVRRRGLSTPPESGNADLQRWIDAVNDRVKGLPPAPRLKDDNLQNWFREVKEEVDGLPFSTFSTSDGPNQSAVTAPEGFIGVEVGSSATKFWFKESGSTSTGWSPWDSGKVTDFNLRVSAGAVSGVSAVNVFGENTDVDNNTDPEDVWDVGGVLDTSLISTASVFTIVSSSASDDGNGSGGTYTGARVIRVLGLQTWDLAESSETVQLSGTSQMVTANSYVFINRMTVISSGDVYDNIGDVDAIQANASGTTQIRIAATKGQSHSAFCALSSLEKLYITDWYGDMDKTGAAGTALFDLKVLTTPDTADSTWVTDADLGVISVGNSSFEHQFRPYLPVTGPALTKVEMEEVSATNVAVSAGFDAFLVKNTVVL